jgi:hypothetical protein
VGVLWSISSTGLSEPLVSAETHSSPWPVRGSLTSAFGVELGPSVNGRPPRGALLCA